VFCHKQNNRLAAIRSRIIDGAIQRAQQGSRNEACLWLGCQERDNGLGQALAEHDVEIVAATIGGRDFSRREAISAVRSAYRRPAREPWTGRLKAPNPNPRFRSEEFRRLLAAARDAAQRERIARARGLELMRALDFESPDWTIIDAHCLADKDADRLLAVATWLERAADAEVDVYRKEVVR
jgi:hypothetical protein